MKSPSLRRPHVVAVIPAGGSGVRLGGAIPKQFLSLDGMPILLRTLRAFSRHRDVTDIVIVGPARHLPRIHKLVTTGRVKKVAAIVEGGKNRQASVWNGIRAASAAATVIVVHDAVRPLVSFSTISSVIEAAGRWGAAVAACPSRDTVLWEGREGVFTRTLDRSRLWNVQTPQAFRRPLLVQAHEQARRSRFLGTDEASLILRLGKTVHIVPSPSSNIKITTREDLKVALALLNDANP